MNEWLNKYLTMIRSNFLSLGSTYLSVTRTGDDGFQHKRNFCDFTIRRMGGKSILLLKINYNVVIILH